MELDEQLIIMGAGVVSPVHPSHYCAGTHLPNLSCQQGLMPALREKHTSGNTSISCAIYSGEVADVSPIKK